MYSKNQFRIFIFRNKILYNLNTKLKKITKKKAFSSTFLMIILKSYLKSINYSDSNKTSLKLSINVPSLYLRLDNFPKNYTKLGVFLPSKVFKDHQKLF